MNTIKISPDYLIINGRPRFIFGGDLNYGRMRQSQWRDRFRKLRAAGMNTVTFYCAWIFHEPRRGEWCFEGNLDLGAFMDMAHDEGLFTIPRIGPFVHGEMRNGGLPQWLIDELGDRVRTNDACYLEETGRWYERILPIILPRCVTRGGGAILIQLENELGSAGSKGDDVHRGSEEPAERARHILYYNGLLQKHGIDIPLIDINKDYPGKEELRLVDTGGSYPVNCFGSDGEICPVSHKWWQDHVRPKITIETIGGMFVRYYDWPAYRNTDSFQGPLIKPAILESVSFGHLAEGCSGINYFVLNDSEHPDEGAERMIPERSYNFQAPLSVAGNTRESYRVLKRLGWFFRSFEQELLRSVPHESWAAVKSHGQAHPGVQNAGGDLFSGYHQQSSPHTAECNDQPVDAASRVTKGLGLGEANFILLRNTRNHGAAWQRDIRISTNPQGIPCEVYQEYPKRTQLDLAPDENRILPFFVRLQEQCFLEYSTGMLLDRRPWKNGCQVVLHGRSGATIETRFVLPQNCTVRSRRGSLCTWESPNTVSVIAIAGPEPEIIDFDLAVPLRLMIFDTQSAGDVWDVPFGNKNLLGISNLRVLGTCTDGALRLQSGDRDFRLELFTDSRPRLTGPFSDISETWEPEYGRYLVTGALAFDAPEIVFHSRHNRSDLVYEAEISPDMLPPECHDLCLLIHHDGSTAEARLGAQLIADHAYGKHFEWEVRLKDWCVTAGKMSLIFHNARRVEIQVRPVWEFEGRIELA